MSKFLKFIVNVFLVFAIAAAAAILIPPLLGVTTTIVDTPSMNTNLPFGSITYSTDIDVADLRAGDEVLKENNASTYAYVVQNNEATEGSYSVRDAYDENAADEAIIFRNRVSKVAVVVPYLGYLIIAMHSIEGIIIVALVVVLMIILFILSELWKKDEEDEEDDEPTEAMAELDADRAVPVETAETKGNVGTDGTPLPVSEVIFNAEDDLPEIRPDLGDDAAGKTHAEPEEVLESEEKPASTSDLSSLYGEDEFDFDENDLDLEDEDELFDDEVIDDAAEALHLSLDEEEPLEEAPAEPVSSENETKPQEEVKAPEAEEPETAENAEPEIDFSDAIFAATAEVEEQELERQKAEVVKPSEEAAPVVKQAEPARIEEQMPEAEHFIPVERPTLEEILEQLKAAGIEPDTKKDPATGITLVDYSKLL